jgi:prolyl-tRNA synthetase
MRASRFFISTLKEAPSDAEIVSHKLMMRAGMIKRLGSGIYTYMPLGLRVIRKVEAIVREEMNKAGAIELLMPLVQPAELWQETGRWDKMGPELLRLKDRHGRDFALQPTSEEVVTDVVRGEIKSYRQLPLNFYHIQTKFRDERRPRFGLMRGREFTMKDAYSFDRDVEGMQASYQTMFDAYVKIFNRFGLKFRAVAADNGAIGGTGSHEFHVIASTGEDAIVYCPTSDYAANMEAAEALPLIAARGAATQALTKVSTPDTTKCEQVAKLLGLELSQTVKSIALTVENEVDGKVTKENWLLLLRGDHELNEVKVSKVPGLKDFRFATEAEILEAYGSVPGYLGPIGTKQPVKVVADRTVANMADFVCGANEAELPPDRRQLGPRPAGTGGRRPAQRGRGRRFAGRQGRAGDRARHRSGPRVPARHRLFAAMNCDLPGREGPAGADADGLLRHRRDPHPGRGDRAELRRQGHRLAGRHRAVRAGAVPDGV